MAGNALLHAEHILDLAQTESGMHVADIGCGRSGHLVFPAARRVGEGGRVYAVDIQPGIVESLTNHCAHVGANNVEPLWGDFERSGGVEIADGSLDRLFFVNNLWLLNDPGIFFAEVKRLLKPEGVCVFVDWHKRAEHPVAPPKHVRTDLVQAMHLAAAHGASLANDTSLSQTHWGLVLRVA